jgi:hypothetical protein
MTDLVMIRGDDVTFDLPLSSDVSDARGAAFTVKRSTGDLDIDAMIRKDLGDGVVLDESAAHIRIDAGDTRDLRAPVAFVWDLEVIRADGLTQTMAAGILLITPDVTRESGLAIGSGS